MSKDQLKIPSFQSSDEFHNWWKSPEVIQFCHNHPDKVERLQDHHLIKPWLEQLKIKPNQPSVFTPTQGKAFGKYLIEKKLGQGGMGVVYLASDLVLKRQVALKIMLLEEKEMIERFTREAQAMAKLKHPNIIQVYEVGTIDKYHYFTMDYIQGSSLEELIKDGQNRLTHRRAVEIIRDIALALDYAHKQGIIHRDIKPSNILIDSTNHPYLMDFGLAKELTGLDRSLTMSGSIMGTPDYMSPEQAKGDKKRIDHRSDIFSLGATLYHSLSGQRPFTGKELYQILDQVVNKEPIPPSRLIRGLSADLETICLKCLDKEKERRYQTSKELANDISRYLAGEEISARPIGTLSKILKKVRMNKLATISITGIVIIITIAVTTVINSSIQKKQEIEKYRKQAYEFFEKNKFEETIAVCHRLLILSPQDEEAKYLLRKSETAINDKEDKSQSEKERTKAEEEKIKIEKEKLKAEAEKLRLEKERSKAEAEKMREEKIKAETETEKIKKDREIRERAKAILDRINVGTPTPDEKIKAAQDALDIDPSYGDAYQVMGYAYKDKNNYNKAYEYFSKAIEKTPTLAYSYYERAYITIYKYKKPEEAINDLKKVVELDPNSLIGYFSKGGIDFDLCNYDQAIADYSEAIRLQPDYEEAYNNRGVAYYHNGEFDKAIADYNEAIRLDPKNVDAYSNRGLAYEAKGEFNKAFKNYNEAIRLDPKYATAYYNRGIAYYDKGELDKTIADYNEAIRLNPKYAESYNNRGITYAAKGELDKAFKDYNEAIRLNPEYAEAYCSRGNAYSTKGELDKAIADYNEAIRLDPKCAEAYLNRGYIYTYKKELDKAIEDYTEAIRLNQKYIEAYCNRGIVYAAKGELDKAIADEKMFLKLAPNDPQAAKIRKQIEKWEKELQNR